MISGLAQVIEMKPIFRSFFSGGFFSCAMASSAPNGKTEATAAYAVDAPTARRKRRRVASPGMSARMTADSMTLRFNSSSSSMHLDRSHHPCQPVCVHARVAARFYCTAKVRGPAGVHRWKARGWLTLSD